MRYHLRERGGFKLVDSKAQPYEFDDLFHALATAYEASRGLDVTVCRESSSVGGIPAFVPVATVRSLP